MNAPFLAGQLPPAFQARAARQVLRFGEGASAVQVSLPVLDADALQALARHVRAGAREHLQRLRVSQLVELIDRAVGCLLDPAHPARQTLDALLPRVTGYDAEMVARGLNAYLQAFRAPQLHRFVAEDFANPKVLDEFQPAAKGGAVRAFGPGLLAHSWAGNVPGLPLWSLASGLLVKAGNIGKLPSAEPVFASVAAQLLVELHPPLAEALAIVWWKGAEPGGAQALYAQADAVLAYGGNAAIAQVRAQVPATTRFLPFGHKLGVALVGRCGLDAQRGPPLARRAAQDVARWEQQGCYSPQVVYVERGGALSPRDFARHLAAELANLQRRFPRRKLALDEATAVAAWRQGAELRTLAGEGADLFGDESAPWAVAYDDRLLPLAPGAGQRCVQVVAVDALDDAVDALAPHAAFLQTAGVAVAPARLYRLAERLGVAGLTRLCALGRMAAPEAGWHHDGRFNLLDLVRMVEIEASAEAAADRLAPYAQEDAW